MRPILIIASVLMLITHHDLIKFDDFFTSVFPVKSPTVYKNVSSTKTIYHKFSSKTKPDKFEISLKGKTILSGKITFTIHNPSGKLIYKDSFDANLLIDYGINDDNPAVKQQEAYITKRFATFFDNDKFDQPAVKKTDKFDKDYSEDIKVWKEIRADPAAVGFTYLTGEENSRSITWSINQQKVVVYFSCC
ncbi:MAG: hypothetical protein EOP42_13235 [Sphingobacteriaceae bacterium]|nr:MAG: hypothetical protein EOP42_13235 [Sphingobacteriaceae bacterium]